jgi:twitching motility two-component system response regulator PilH
MFNNKKVLVVDDSATERHILADITTKLGFDVYQAENGEDGIRKAEELKPDLILMDVVMPGLNGFQATRQINRTEELKNIPIIMCTSKNADTDKLWGKRQGAVAYLVKPIKEVDLVEAIKNVL